MSRKILDLSGLNYYDGKIKSYVETKAAEAAAGKITMEVLVGNLPNVSDALLNVIYLKPNSEGESGNSYDEYIVKVVSSVRSWEKIGTTQADLNAKANKSEMSVVDNGNGTATITLKTGTAATVLTQHQDISGKANRANDPTPGHLASLTAEGHLADSGINDDNVLLDTDIATISTGDIDNMFYEENGNSGESGSGESGSGSGESGSGESGSGTISLISFTIDGGTYYADPDMTWESWCPAKSRFHPNMNIAAKDPEPQELSAHGAFTIREVWTYSYSGSSLVWVKQLKDSDGFIVTADESIISGKAYVLTLPQNSNT